ncbi:MAG: hypothetical protein A2126_04105 [Candidatus Woykebacteria bacterium GWB1_45_5]|uniref:PPM-type phosphatase domain-containing protein n=2 Tax=Candidatus Woykeibacteriota TaxID=1817899 RepID=A0A1G1W1F1_9BACT|nr:MAG: hypothetical protein A2113_01910 [Candidatus Woykebacteria bacterium GWA1_44_8]OGY22330.1 MAG: hypothetical protein A2126_04105 [Candidatus Woykebacteria bacterium GWB1_45_5]
MKLNYFAASIPSISHPKNNQDAYFIDEKEGVAGVFDGVGGLPHAGQAASWAASCFQTELKLESMEKAFQKCHLTLKEKGIETFGREGATTAAIAKIYPTKETEYLVVWGSVGDSRVYHLTSDGLRRSSISDSLVTQALEKGWINQAKAEKIDQATNLKGLNEIEKGLFQSRNILTQALGIGVFQPRIGKFKVKKGESVILTTDGVNDNLTDKEIAEILKQADKDPAKALVESAAKVPQSTSLRAKPDDMTAIVLKFEL